MNGHCMPVHISKQINIAQISNEMLQEFMMLLLLNILGILLDVIFRKETNYF